MGTQSICGLGLLSFLKFGAGAQWLGFEISKGLYQGFPDNSIKNLPAMQDTPVQFLGQERSPGDGIGYPLQYSWVSLVAQLVKNLPAIQETWDLSWVGKIPWRRERLNTPVFWPGEFHRLYNPWGHKESDTTERLSLSLFPGGSVVKSPPANARDTGDLGSIPGWGRSPGRGNGNPLSILA